MSLFSDDILDQCFIYIYIPLIITPHFEGSKDKVKNR